MNRLASLVATKKHNLKLTYKLDLDMHVQTQKRCVLNVRA